MAQVEFPQQTINDILTHLDAVYVRSANKARRSLQTLNDSLRRQNANGDSPDTFPPETSGVTWDTGIIGLTRWQDLARRCEESIFDPLHMG